MNLRNWETYQSYVKFPLHASSRHAAETLEVLDRVFPEIDWSALTIAESAEFIPYYDGIWGEFRMEIPGRYFDRLSAVLRVPAQLVACSFQPKSNKLLRLHSDGYTFVSGPFVVPADAA